MKYLKQILFWGSAIALVGCNSSCRTGGVGQQNVGPMVTSGSLVAQQPSVEDGVWKRMRCENKTHNTHMYSRMKAHVFNRASGTYTRLKWYFEGHNCDPRRAYKRKRYVASYVMGSPVSGGSLPATGTWAVDITYQRFYRTYYETPMNNGSSRLAFENRRRECGIANWLSGVERNVTGAACNWTRDATKSAVYTPGTIYEVVSVDARGLRLGNTNADPTLHAGRGPNQRPNQLYTARYAKSTMAGLPAVPTREAM